MVTYTQHRSAEALFWLASVLQAGTQGVYATAKRLDAWLDKRREHGASLRDLESMSAHELFDIGLTRNDVSFAARDAWFDIRSRL
jgi:uncharacterized protein YjiS (DUF1127 family)